MKELWLTKTTTKQSLAEIVPRGSIGRPRFYLAKKEGFC